MRIDNTDIQGIIFDLDGTLANSIKDIGDAMNRVLAGKGFPLHSYGQYRFLVGKGLKNLVTSALPENNRQPEIIQQCYNLMLDDYGHNYMVNTKPYDGIPELLDRLYLMQIKMAVLSNKNDNITKIIVGELFDHRLFETVLGSTPETPGKPNPEAAFKIARKMGLDAKNIAFIGDTSNDMQTAVNAGMLPIGVLWGFRTRDELLAHGAKVLLQHPSELFG